jgi:N-acetyl-beta-hexosaminidase
MDPMWELNRRQWLAGATAAALGAMAGGCHGPSPQATAPAARDDQDLRLLPYPQAIVRTTGSIPIGKPIYHGIGAGSPTVSLAMDCLNRRLPAHGTPLPVRLGSIEEGFDASWLTPADTDFLSAPGTSAEASVVTIAPAGITVVGKDKWGMLYGVQTICQLLEGAACRGQRSLPCLNIRDWPDRKWRCLAPTLTWYSGWNRLEGYDLCN